MRWRDEFGDAPQSAARDGVCSRRRHSSGSGEAVARLLMERLQLPNGPLELTSLRGRMCVYCGDRLPQECVSVHARVLTSRRMGGGGSSSQLDGGVTAPSSFWMARACTNGSRSIAPKLARCWRRSQSSSSGGGAGGSATAVIVEQPKA